MVDASPALVPFWFAVVVRSLMGRGAGFQRSRSGLSHLFWGVGDCGERGVSPSKWSREGREGGVGPWLSSPRCGVSIGLQRTAAAGMLMDVRDWLMLDEGGPVFVVFSAALASRAPEAAAAFC